jgi:Lrp/AsnC family leucine-responsive transcriptional regulator
LDRIDAIDAEIVRLLQENGRIKRSEIAEVVGLSVPSVSDRMRKLEQRGVVTGYTSRIDAKRLGFDITVFMRVSVDGSEHYPEFVRRATARTEVLELHSSTGEGSHLMKVRLPSTTALERFLAEVQTWPGVRGTQSSVVLSTFKETQTLHVQPGPLTPRPDH